jgi:hypothetical protein
LLSTGEGRLEKLVKIAQASDLTTLVSQCDEAMIKFLRRFLEEGLRVDVIPVLDSVRRKFPDIGEKDIEHAVREFRRALAAELAKAKNRRNAS